MYIIIDAMKRVKSFMAVFLSNPMAIPLQSTIQKLYLKKFERQWTFVIAKPPERKLTHL